MREHMAAADAAWFRMDRPGNTADVVSLLTFAELPPADAIRRRIEERLLALRRFRQVPRRGSALGGDAWEDDPAFSLDHHLVELRLPGDNRDALRALLDDVATRALDPDRPPWRAWMVRGPGSAAIVTKIHHCLADGFALVAVLLSLADEQREHRGSRHTLEASRRLEPWLHPAELLREARRSPRRALAIGVEAGGLALAFARNALLPADHHDTLTPPLSGRRRVACSRGVSLTAIRRAARLRHAGVNDLLLAAVAGALRSELQAAGETVEPHVRALVPVNLRPGIPDPARDALGNRFGLLYLDLPTDLPSPEARLQAVRGRVQAARSRPDAVASFGIFAGMGALPPLAAIAASVFTPKASVVLTSVPGPRRRLHLAGATIESAMFWVPHPMKLGLGVSVLTYAGEARMGVRADEAVSVAPSALVARFEAEVAALGGGAPRDEPSTWAGASGTRSP